MTHPRIGLNCDISAAHGTEVAKVNWAYVSGVVAAGGVPVLLAPVDEMRIASMLDVLDGLVLTGGRDYDPAGYGRPRDEKCVLLDPRRDRFDRRLVLAALARGIPTLGICGGAQLINIAKGGTLYQHIPDRFGAAIRHEWSGGEEPFHEVEVEEGSRLASIVGAGRLEVNSSHHQAVELVGEGLRVVARSADGVVEAIEGVGEPFLLGVQWHPERLPHRPVHQALFRTLVEVARRA
ncbi:MAG TPA: gamma-glutamyl-gamma-aminobutyrate hydrolase family protein [Planctomycetota bacterium]|nr:gamma-glutamyl-gamma-aminobutyrate hydrolase family protein [Planctomycetota bacterium]HRR78572.1 gamma-glutamyl-gamma-aminobutyrate hydrolase family protein [Planctomycetota bacterium]HRT96581.1 gamma-glutamyl-gamma-aminobutyrate hydrolase family protein [Planctomycetota bacterium]